MTTSALSRWLKPQPADLPQFPVAEVDWLAAAEWWASQGRSQTR